MTRTFLNFIILGMMLFAGPAILRAEEDELFVNFQNRAKYQDILVDRVISADTIVLSDGEKFHLIGLNAPETPRRARMEYDKNGQPILPTPKPDDESINAKALNFAIKLLEGKHVRIELGEQRQDENLGQLAYVFLISDNRLANAEILRQGYADLQIRPPNLKYAEQLREAYREARREKRGLQSD